MPEHDLFLLKKGNVFFQGTFRPVALGSIFMEPHGLRKLINVNKQDLLLQ